MTRSSLNLSIFIISLPILITSFLPRIVTVKTSIKYSRILAQEYDVLREDSFIIKNSNKKNQAQVSVLVTEKREYKRLKKDTNVKILKKKIKKLQTRFDFDSYPCYRTVNETFISMKLLSVKYPLLVTLQSIGSSYGHNSYRDDPEDKFDIQVLKITSSSFSSEEKAPMFVMGGAHARELAPPETIMRWAEYLVQSYNVDAESTMLLDRTTIYVLPIGNPDGRFFMQNNMRAYYRKNTHPSGCNRVSADGVDLNRNFDLRWGDLSGSSRNPCQADYHGKESLSEPETLSIFQYCQDEIFNSSNYRSEFEINEKCPEHVEHTGLFIDVHSYGRYIYYPYGFDLDSYPPNTQPILSMASKLSSFEESQLWGPGGNGFLYTVSGDATDSIYGLLCVPSYGFEIGSQFYETCQDYEAMVLDKVLKALTFAAKTAKNGYLIPLGPDVIHADYNFLPDENLLFLEASIEDMDFHGMNRDSIVNKVYCFTNVHPDDYTEGNAIQMNFISNQSDDKHNRKSQDKSGIATLELDVSEWERFVRYTLYFVAEDTGGNRGTVMPLFITLQ